MDLNWALAYYWCALGLSILTIVGQARIIGIIARQLSDLFKYTNDGENSNDDELQLIEFEKKTFSRSSVLWKKKRDNFPPECDYYSELSPLCREANTCWQTESDNVSTSE